MDYMQTCGWRRTDNGGGCCFVYSSCKRCTAALVPAGPPLLPVWAHSRPWLLLPLLPAAGAADSSSATAASASAL